jgi:hypothetical protein
LNAININGGIPMITPDAMNMKLANTLLYRIARNISRLVDSVGSGMLLNTPSKLWAEI